MLQGDGSSSPEIRTSDILVASSSGWSPQRLNRRTAIDQNLNAGDVASSPMSPSESGSPSRPSRTFDSNALKSHGYVSNSIFKKAGDNTTPSEAHQSLGMSPNSSSMGVGLGIGVTGDVKSPRTPTRKTSTERFTRSPDLCESSRTAPKTLHSSAQAPRKSRGFEVLTKSSYVSKSPFKQAGGPQSPDMATEDFPKTRPLSISSSPKRRQHDSAMSPPASPSRRREFATGLTDVAPRGDSSTIQQTVASNSSVIRSPTTQGTGDLVQSQYPPHQPRPQKIASLTDEEVATRRKTVTFDEELEVQEFDRESSFDGGSLKSGCSNVSLTDAEQAQQPQSSPSTTEEAQFWIGGSHVSQQQCFIVTNGGPGSNSSPELSDHHTDEDDACSLTSAGSKDNSASEASEAEELGDPRFQLPVSSPMEEFSLTFQKGFETTSPLVKSSDATAGGVNHINSLVDELLQTDLLAAPVRKYSKNISSQQQSDTIVEPLSPATKQESAAARSLAARLAAACSAKSSPTESSSPEAWQSGSDGSTSTPLRPTDDVEDTLDTPKKRRSAEASSSATLLANLPPPPSEIDSASTQGAHSMLSPLNIGLPTLPSWSPLLSDSQTMANLSHGPPSPVFQPQSTVAIPRGREAGRPHISRDAVLARVAREKRAQAEAIERETSETAEAADTSMPASLLHTEAPSRGRPSAPAASMRPTQSMNLSNAPQRPTAAPRPHPEASSFEVRQEPTPTAVEKNVVADSASPLERLSESLAQQVEETQAQDSEKQQSSLAGGWFDGSSAGHETESAATAGASGEVPPTSEIPLASESRPALRKPESQSDLVLAQRKQRLAQRKRSMSTGDARPPISLSTRCKAEKEGMSGSSCETNIDRRTLDAPVQKALDLGFSNALCRDISRIFREGDNPYHVKDQGTFSAAVDDKVSHSRQAGDVDSGKAWRKLRRPSDINEYAEEMRAYRASENPMKAAGKIFVSVDSFRPAGLPIPYVAPTRFFCILDNGLHVVKTGTSTLRPGQGTVSPIQQEFELIQHKNLAFSLTLFLQKDTHLLLASRGSSVSSIAGSRPGSPTKKDKQSFMSKLLRSPKKNTSRSGSTERGTEPSLLSYTNQEGALGKVSIVFEKVAAKCLGKAFTLELPVLGVADAPSTISRNTMYSDPKPDFSRNINSSRGILKLTLFYLPPMPSVPKQMLPQNMQECIKGMQWAKWHHGGERLSGTLTQQGGDCSTWRRRPVKAQSSYLICYNEVTKRPIVKIDLSKAVKIEESWDPCSSDPSKKGRDASTVRGGAVIDKYDIKEEPDESYHVARSFRVTFADGERISFFADTDEEKKQWIEVMAEMIHTERPPNPMWAQVAFDLIRNAQSGIPTTSGRPNTSASSSGNLPRLGSGLAAKRAVATPATVQEESGSLNNTPQRNSLASPAKSTPVSNPSAARLTPSAGILSRDPTTPISSRAAPPQSRPLSQQRQRPLSPTKHSTLPLIGGNRRAPPMSNSTNTVSNASIATPTSSSSRKPRPGRTAPPPSSSSSSSSAAPDKTAPTVPPRRASVNFTPTRKISSTPFGG